MCILCFNIVIWVQDQETKKLRGRRELKDFRHEAKRTGGYTVRKKHRLHKLTLKDPQLEYTKRYIAESGF
jgi:hypothetical protein